jgi:hypothetical protein
MTNKEIDKLYQNINNITIKDQDIIYQLLNKSSKLTLFESDEVKNPKTKIKYEIIICNNPLIVKLFIVFLALFEQITNMRIKRNDEHRKVHVGIDYEFRMNKIALMQLNFEGIPSTKEETVSHIFLVNPGEFNQNDTQILIDKLMTNIHIYKIFHGADSRDIPYMFQELFDNNKDYIKMFTSKLLDTRFLCEYYKLSIDQERACSINDALEYFDVISKEKKQELIDIHDQMGPVQDISWNINTLSSYHIKYALYDVLFLQNYLSNIYKFIMTNTPKYVNTYKYINCIIRFLILEKRGITDILEKVKPDVNAININYIRIKGRNVTLTTIYEDIIKDLVIHNGDGDVNINLILKLPYATKSMKMFFKTIIYSYITEKFKVYKNKTTVQDLKINYNLIIKDLNQEGYDSLVKFCNEFRLTIINKFDKLYS